MAVLWRRGLGWRLLRALLCRRASYQRHRVWCLRLRQLALGSRTGALLLPRLLLRLPGPLTRLYVPSFSIQLPLPLAGLYLVSAAADKSLVLWDVNERKCLQRRTLPGAATGLAWHPSNNELAIVTEDGAPARAAKLMRS